MTAITRCSTERTPAVPPLPELLAAPRTARINGVRAAPEVKALLEKVLTQKDQSFADWLIEKIVEDSNAKNKTD